MSSASRGDAGDNGIQTVRGGPRAEHLSDLIQHRSIVVCCGSGGVGKTTVAAALAMEGARRGRTAVVVTIDPARRLANALGIESLTNEPSRISGDWPGELWALMLDTKSTFDSLVATYARTPEQERLIIENRFYRNISGALAGTEEYMATEKLYELHQRGQFDLIVVDTPPTRNALDFLDAPNRITRFLENRVFRVLVRPDGPYQKVLNMAAMAVLRSISKVVGADVMNDVTQFFTAFEGMEGGFRARAQRVLELLSDPDTSFVLVASPRRDAVEEATFFADRLAEADIPVEALVVNRLHPSFPFPPEGGADGQSGGAVHGDQVPPGASVVARPEADRERARTLAGTRLGSLYANLADFRLVAQREEEHLAGLVAKVTPAPVARVPFLAADVHDLPSLAEVGRYLFTGGARSSSSSPASAM